MHNFPPKTIALAADHAGFILKNLLIEHLSKQNYQVIDCGAFELVPEDDYPDFVLPAAKKVQAGEVDCAIVIGGSGQGEAMISNRLNNVRAVVFNGQTKDAPDEIKVSREHNNANILSLGARFINIVDAFKAVDEWLTTPFLNEERHVRRLKKIEEARS